MTAMAGGRQGSPARISSAAGRPAPGPPPPVARRAAAGGGRGRSSPRVTVLTTVYNRAAYLGATMESVLAQRFSDLELLIVDDGSTDASLEVASSFRDPRVRVVRNPTNLGIPRTRNRGLEEARGEYLAILDSDDLARPERLERQVRYLDAHPEVAVVGSFCAWIDERGRRLRRVKRRPVKPEDVRAALLFRCPIQNSAATGRTALLRRFGYRAEFAVGEDYDLWARLSATHRLANLPEVLVDYRVHSERTPRTGMQRLRTAIVREQLVALGIEPRPEDVARHLRAIRCLKRPGESDRPLLEWAAEWLARLARANERTGRYPEPAFGRALARFWRGLLWQYRGPRRWSILSRPSALRLACGGSWGRTRLAEASPRRRPATGSASSRPGR